jgi:hypothetical protein
MDLGSARASATADGPTNVIGRRRSADWAELTFKCRSAPASEGLDMADHCLMQSAYMP